MQLRNRAAKRLRPFRQAGKQAGGTRRRGGTSTSTATACLAQQRFKPQHGTAQHDTAQHDTAQHGTAQQGTGSTAQRSTAQRTFRAGLGSGCALGWQALQSLHFETLPTHRVGSSSSWSAPPPASMQACRGVTQQQRHKCNRKATAVSSETARWGNATRVCAAPSKGR
jgi:hypothetical protein